MSRSARPRADARPMSAPRAPAQDSPDRSPSTSSNATSPTPPPDHDMRPTVCKSATEGPESPRNWTGRRALGETILVSCASASLGVITGVLTARLLGPEGRGALALAIAVSAMISAVIGFGLAQGFSVLVAERRARASMAVGLSVWTGLCIGGSVTALAWVATPLLVGDTETARTIQIGLLAIPGSIAGVCLAGVLRGMRLGRRYNVTRLLAPALYGSGVAFLAIYDRITVLGVLTTYVVSMTISAFGAYALTPRAVRRISALSLRFTRSAYRYGVAASPSGIANVVKIQFALPVLAATASANEVGFYAVGLSYAIPVGLVTASIGVHTLPDVAAAARADRAGLVQRRIRLNAASLLVIGGLSVLAAPLIVPLAFGEEFVPAVRAAQLLVIAQAVSSVILLQAEVCRGLGRPGLASAAEGLGIVGTLALLPVIVPAFQIIGAACVPIAVNAGVAVLLRHKMNVELSRVLDATQSTQ